MAYVSNQLFTVLFADDTNIFDTNNDLEALISHVNSELHKIMNWLNANKLSSMEKSTGSYMHEKFQKYWYYSKGQAGLW